MNLQIASYLHFILKRKFRFIQYERPSETSFQTAFSYSIAK
ncbi:hypothetical protein NEISUBOT_04483 [Neisseria subflava NJ9703]|uniref:Uncharacterized protein n=1 Tax=Neisseria subflava NJ9703 TaxID=546268 RepID=A0A9W5IQU8_NEISU|nr:hypothetical protein NEISUBOT_04483 [Neisseria subflava NJ9703]